MRYMTRRDLGVVAATSLVLAVIGLGIYIIPNYKIVRADRPPESNQAIANKESPIPAKSNRRSVAKRRTTEHPKKLSDHVVQLKPQQEQPLVAAASPVAKFEPVISQVAEVPQATQPARVTRSEPSNETWQPSQESQVGRDGGRNYPPTSYEQPQDRREEKRGMTKTEKIVVGSAIAGSVITSILLARRHR